MGTVNSDRWGEYNRAQARRPVRPLAQAAATIAGPADGRVAVELGCGIGREASYLADLGWQVNTYDADPSMIDPLARLGEQWPITHTHSRLEDLASLPPCDLFLACASLPFVPAEHFARLWAVCLAALQPGGVLAVDLFGDRDDWATGPGTFLTRTEVEALTTGLELERLDEEEYDGKAFSGPKHWHTYQVIARRR